MLHSLLKPAFDAVVADIKFIKQFYSIEKPATDEEFKTFIKKLKARVKVTNETCKPVESVIKFVVCKDDPTRPLWKVSDEERFETARMAIEKVVDKTEPKWKGHERDDVKRLFEQEVQHGGKQISNLEWEIEKELNEASDLLRWAELPKVKGKFLEGWQDNWRAKLEVCKASGANVDGQLDMLAKIEYYWQRLGIGLPLTQNNLINYLIGEHQVGSNNALKMKLSEMVELMKQEYEAKGGKSVVKVTLQQKKGRKKRGGPSVDSKVLKWRTKLEKEILTAKTKCKRDMYDWYSYIKKNNPEALSHPSKGQIDMAAFAKELDTHRKWKQLHPRKS